MIIRFFGSKKAASLTGYGLVVGLIAVIAISAVTRVGEQVAQLFIGVDNSLSEAINNSQEGQTAESAAAGDPCADPDSLTEPTDFGLLCEDGSFFVGRLLDGNEVFFASSDETSPGNFLDWGVGPAANVAISTDSFDGPANTAALVTFGNTPAAAACDSKTGGNFYLPAQDEWFLFWNNLIDTNNNNTLDPAEQTATETSYGIDFIGATGEGFYWTSSDGGSNAAFPFNLLDGTSDAFDNRLRDIEHAVRCARR